MEFLSNEEIVQRARVNLHQGAWDYLVGASESETTMRRNRLAFDQVAFRPRVLVDVSSVDTSTTFLGHNLRIPVLLAPIGSLQVFNPGGRYSLCKPSSGNCNGQRPMVLRDYIRPLLQPSIGIWICGRIRSAILGSLGT